MLLFPAPIQLTVVQSASLSQGLEQIKAIDAELNEIQQHQKVLIGSSPEAVDEIISLKARYPEIVLNEKAGAQEIYRALYEVRKGRAMRLLPLLSEKGRAARIAACQAADKVQQHRREYERGEEYKGMTLSQRLEWRKDMNAIKVEGGCPE